MFSFRSTNRAILPVLRRTPESQQESFSLVSVVPQAPRLNRGLWEGIEAALRTVVRQQGGELFVATGPVFAGAELQALQSRVLIPTSVWKAVYDPAAATAGAYYVANADDGTIRSISVAELRDLSGIDPFPALPEVIKARLMTLPQPTPYRGRAQQ